MNRHVFVRTYFIATSAACVGLAALWWMLCQRNALQADALRPAGVRREQRLPAPPKPPAPVVVAGESSGAAEENPNLLRYASQARRQSYAAAVLALVGRLKAVNRPAVTEMPPPPRSLMGSFFPELLKDPEVGAEYRRLYRELLLSSRSLAVWGGLASQSSDMRSYAALMGDPAVLGLVVDRELAMLERYSMPKDQRDTPEAQALQARQTQLEAQLKAQLLERYGPDEYDRLTTGKGMEFEGELGTLEQRLSYASEPLTAQQRAELKAALRAAQPSAVGPLDVGRQLAASNVLQAQESRANALVQGAATILSPTQLAAFRDLQEERLAFARRRQLPVDSALPKLPGT